MTVATGPSTSARAIRAALPTQKQFRWSAEPDKNAFCASIRASDAGDATYVHRDLTCLQEDIMPVPSKSSDRNRFFSTLMTLGLCLVASCTDQPTAIQSRAKPLRNCVDDGWCSGGY